MKVFYLHGKLGKILLTFLAVVLTVSLIAYSLNVLNKKAKSVYKGVSEGVTVIIDAGHGGLTNTID